MIGLPVGWRMLSSVEQKLPDALNNMTNSGREVGRNEFVK